MILVTDIGNTNVKVGVFDGDELKVSLRVATSQNKTSDEYGLDIINLLRANNVEPSDVNGVVISSVNPNLNYTFEHMVRYYFNVKPMIVGAGVKTGLNVKYDNPKEVGADRIVNSVAAYYLYGGPVIVIDCGTATTFNVINEKGEFLGGAITFGLKTGSDALSTACSKLPKIELTLPSRVIGKSTVSNMQSGIIHGFIGMVENIVNKIKQELKCDNVKVVATGGVSEIVRNSSDVIDVFDRTLTLRGLNIIYKLNEKQQ